MVSGLAGAGLGAVVVDTSGYGAAFGIAGSAGIACAFLTVLLRQPKLKAPARPTDPTQAEPKVLVVG